MAIPTGSACTCQLLPPSVVDKTVPSPDTVTPAAEQSLAPVQLTLKSGPTLLGILCDTHLLPPSVVATTSPALDVVLPDAQQSALLVQDTAPRPPVSFGSF
jgi:hypothetical protein